MARLSLAQQIAQLESTVPEFDPEDAYVSTKPDGVEDQEFEMNGHSAAREHYFDVGPSTLRKLQDSISDPKYEGRKTSRSQVFENPGQDDLAGGLSDDAGEQPSDDDGMENYNSQPFGDVKASDDESSEPGDNDEETSNDEDEEEDDASSGQDATKRGEAVEEKLLTDVLRKAREREKTKGQAVIRQLATWDALLDSRIRLQKSAVAANRLPLPENLSSFVGSESGMAAVSELLVAVTALSDDLAHLQEIYMSVNEPEIPRPAKRPRLETEQPEKSNYESHLNSMCTYTSELESSYHSTLLKTLNKWSQKVQAVAPSALLQSSTTFLRGGRQAHKSAVELIEETIAGGKAVARTRVRRAGDAGRIGSEETSNEGPETLDVDQVFDDVDFYQQLLRDVIDSRTNKDNTTLDAQDAWARKQKKAQKLERALGNKDRRVRFDVHEKLQNFMVPVPTSRGAWHEEQIDELFSSLLGKGFEGTAEPVPMVPNGHHQTLESSGVEDLGGLRIF